MDENVLLFGLYEEVTLIADVTQESANIQLIFTLYLLKHSIQDYVSS